ncbi:MAG TPA: alpha/beta hydrolase [Panacibacter sp.]|nr:alpha/beta hydrolase [Panacibacter sp.]
MRLLLLFSFPLLYILNFLNEPSGLNVSDAFAVKPLAELHDLQAIKFATGLADWRNRPVDSLLMDIFYPTGATEDKKYPMILFCHAGGFTGGKRSNVTAICDRFADEGFIAVALDYRVGYQKGNGNDCESDTLGRSEATYRAMQDAHSCMRFLVAHADEYNIDTSKLFIGGSSAGADLSMQFAYVNDSIASTQAYVPAYQKLGPLESTGNTLTNTFSIKGIICMWGAIKNDKWIDTSYRAIPTIIFKGALDDGLPDSMGHFKGCVNYEILYAGVGIYARMLNQRVPSVYYLLSLAPHPAYDDKFCVEQSSCFLRACMEGRGYSGRYSGYVNSCQY